MKRLGKRCLGVLMAVCMLAGCGSTAEAPSTEETTTAKKPELNLWYTDEAMDTFMAAAAGSFAREHNVTVTPRLMSSIDYLENVNQQNIAETDVADVYILNSESLEKAYMSGLTAVQRKNLSGYPEVAASACRYQGETVALPVYFETEYFLYNKDIVEEAPESFQAIIDFAASDEMSGENAEKYQGLDTILKWDVLDLFYNYQFVGAYLNLGGEDRDDKTVVDINNEQVLEALTFYKELNQSLYFDAEEVEYDSMLQSFLEGKILYTIAGTDSLSVLQQSDMNYGIAAIPALTDSLDSKGISVNYVAVVNPYSTSPEAAMELADYISDGFAEKCYELSGKLPCKKLEFYPVAEFENVMAAYENSVQLPKLMGTTNFWVELEVALNNIWKTEMSEEQAEEGLSGSSQAEDTGAAELKKEQMREQIRTLVTEEITRVQEQMQMQLKE